MDLRERHGATLPGPGRAANAAGKVIVRLMAAWVAAPGALGYTPQVTGLLLVNLGTPRAPTTPAVRRYLREFLGDPRVLDMSKVGRALLLNAVILPFRPRRSAHAYRQVWHPERGSPLLYHSQDLTAAVAAALGPTWQVELAMRYGEPSIGAALDRFAAAGVDRIVVLPLFPQYASSSTGSAVARVWQLAGERWNTPWLDILPPFYDDAATLDAMAAIARPVLALAKADHVLFSFHGLPERQVQKSDTTGRARCIDATCCDAIDPGNRYCYRAQCFATARALVARLGLTDGTYSVGFQSRLGRIPWIKPYSDVRLTELRAAGVRRIAVVSPSFVADCLETLEEIGLRARADWQSAGGEELVLVPSLNAHPAWVDAVAGMAERALRAGGGRRLPVV